jgi:DNA-binding beta-propeller fold protein YncE
MIEKQRSDSIWSWEWTAPNDTMDTVIDLKIEDSGGHGERLYKIHLISYYEFGSIRVASENEIAKFSPNGSRVLSIRDERFKNISDIAVHSNTEKLFVVDQYTNTFIVYDTYGNEIPQPKGELKNPTSIAVDIEGLYVWIADSSDVVKATIENENQSRQSRFRLRAYDFATGAIGGVAYEFNDFSGAIRGLSTDKYDRTRLWFTLPETDTIGYVQYNISTGESKVEYIKSDWNRPSMISLNPDNELAWVADSSRIVAIRKNDWKEMAIITGFGFVSAVSANGNAVWASDIFTGKVYKFSGPFTGKAEELKLTVTNGREVKADADGSGFSQPSFVSAYIADGSVWVMDRGKGKAVKVNSSGDRILLPGKGTGLRPLIGKTIQKVE